MNLTKTMVKLLRWVKENPGKYGPDIPHQFRPTLRTAEEMDLLIYGTKGGWRLTPNGVSNLEVKQ